MRNFFASYRGGAASRAGTKFVGICKQGNQGNANTALPPRNIPFQFSTNQGIVIEAGDKYFRFISDDGGAFSSQPHPSGANTGYITEAKVTIAGISMAASAVVTTATAHGYAQGDEVFITGVVGPTGLNGRQFIVSGVTDTTHFSLVNPLDGMPISTLQMSAYVSGGTAARIYTLATPYAAADLAALKYAQSADVMTI